MKEKFKIIIEDYNISPVQWYIMNEEVFSKGLKKISCGEIEMDSLFIFREDKVSWGAKKKEIDNSALYFSHKINDVIFQEKLVGKQYKYLAEIKKFSDKLVKTDLSKKSNKELFKIYSQFYDLYARTQIWGIVSFLMDIGDKKFSEKVSEEIRNKFNFKDHNIIFSKLITPNKELYYSKENGKILETIKKIQEDSKKKKKIQRAEKLNDLPNNLRFIFKNLAKKYGWLQYYYIGPSADAEYYFNLVKEKINSNVLKEVSKKIKEKKILRDFQDEYEKKMSLKLVKKINTLKEFIYLKEYRKEIQVYFLNFSMDRWFKEVAKRFYLTPLQAKYILKDEYRGLLLKGKEAVVTSRELNNRYSCFSLLLEKGKSKIYSGKEAEKYQNFFEKKRVKRGGTKLEGSVAFPGKKRGKVKIINSAQDLNKFKDGNILVSFSTNPSLMPAINKASAIVTNTGGVTCHAAIISRELKIPCIIGTKIATQVLKDGDMVEVDANKGKIKIIK